MGFNIPYGPQFWRALAKWPFEKWCQLNTLIRFATFACDSLTWWTYVETALPPLGEFALALVGFDWDDIARGFLRPTGIRSRPSLFGELLDDFLVKKEIPELGEIIGAKLPGARVVKSFTNHPLTRALFKIDAFLQRGVYYWMVLDLTTDFFYNWALGLFRTEVCAQSSVAASYIYCTYQTPRVHPPGSWFGAAPIYPYCERKWHTGGGITYDWFHWGHKEYDCFVVWSAKFRAKGLRHTAGRGAFALMGTDGLMYDFLDNVPAGVQFALTAYVPAGHYVMPMGVVYGPDDLYRITLEPVLMQGWALVKVLEGGES